MGLKKRGFPGIIGIMIRDIRPLQSTDQSRLRDEAKRGGTDDFARVMRAYQSAQDGTPDIGTNANRPLNISTGQNRWNGVFTTLGANAVNDDSGPLFHWGEARQHAKEHTALARRSATLNGNTPLHILNEEI